MSCVLKICCLTGQRPKAFPWNYYDETLESQKEYRSTLKDTVERFIKEGYNYFISGGAQGAELDFAETVLKLRKKYPYIQLEIALSHLKQARFYTAKEKIRYAEVLTQADTITILSRQCTRNCAKLRDLYMVNKAELVISAWNCKRQGDTYRILDYAEKQNKQTELIELPAFLTEMKELENLLYNSAAKIKLPPFEELKISKLLKDK